MDKQQREYIHHLMLQYSDAMVRLTYRRVGDWHLAEDLVQETFLTACCKSERVGSSPQMERSKMRKATLMGLFFCVSLGYALTGRLTGTAGQQ